MRTHFFVAPSAQFGRDPLVHRLIAADRRSQGVEPAIRRLAELYGKLPEQVLCEKIATGLANLVLEGLRESEVLKQRDNIGEGLMERRHVGIAPEMIAAMQAVQEGMGGFVRNNVVRDGAVDLASRKDGSHAVVKSVHLAEHEQLRRRAVKGVFLPQSMRMNSQPRYIFVP